MINQNPDQEKFTQKIPPGTERPEIVSKFDASPYFKDHPVMQWKSEAVKQAAEKQRSDLEKLAAKIEKKPEDKNRPKETPAKKVDTKKAAPDVKIKEKESPATKPESAEEKIRRGIFGTVLWDAWDPGDSDWHFGNPCFGIGDAENPTWYVILTNEVRKLLWNERQKKWTAGERIPPASFPRVFPDEARIVIDQWQSDSKAPAVLYYTDEEDDTKVVVRVIDGDSERRYRTKQSGRIEEWDFDLSRWGKLQPPYDIDELTRMTYAWHKRLLREQQISAKKELTQTKKELPTTNEKADKKPMAKESKEKTKPSRKVYWVCTCENDPKNRKKIIEGQEFAIDRNSTRHWYRINNNSTIVSIDDTSSGKVIDIKEMPLEVQELIATRKKTSTPLILQSAEEKGVLWDECKGSVGSTFAEWSYRIFLNGEVQSRRNKNEKWLPNRQALPPEVAAISKARMSQNSSMPKRKE